MTLQQGAELEQIAAQKGYALAAKNGLVQFQVIAAKGDIEKEITGWVSYDEAIEIMGVDDE